MSAFDDALAYAARGWPVFPCSTRKVPFTEHGHADASTDPDRIRTWWAQLPYALIGMPTGERTGLAVLDIDMKRGKNGLRPLSGLLGTSELPVTPTGGLHLHFRRPEGGFGNTVGAAGRGIGEGLDWRCDGGYVVLPSKGTGYRWYNHTHDTCAPIDVPEVLLPRRVDPDPYGRHGAGVSGRRDSAAAANLLAGVARKLAEAPGAEGNRNWLLYWCACRFGEAIAQGVIAEDDARSILAGAARHLGLTDREISATIKSGFGRTGR